MCARGDAGLQPDKRNAKSAFKHANDQPEDDAVEIVEELREQRQIKASKETAEREYAH